MRGPAMMPAGIDRALVDQVDAEVKRRDARQPRNGEITFTCPESKLHQNGDAHPSARWNYNKAVWYCDVCNNNGGAIDLAQRLGLRNDEQPTHRSRETARWTIRDETGHPVAVHIRLEPGRNGKPKDCVWERPDGQTGLGGRKVEDLPLYGVHELASAPKGAMVTLVEGEKARDALARRGVVAVGTVTGASHTPSDTTLRTLARYRVILWPDADNPGRDHMRRIADRLKALGIPYRLFDPWADATDKRDAADFSGTGDELRTLLDEVAPTTEATGASAPLAGLLGATETILSHYVVFRSTAERTAIVLWVAHAHALDAFDVTAYLNVRSAEKRSGKTRLLEVLKELVPQPWQTVQPSEAVLFRKIARDTPTLLLDEVDAIFKGPPTDRTEGLRAVLNAGYRRGATVDRCAGKDRGTLVAFGVFCPKVLAGIGTLPDTIADRCIPIVLSRRKSSEPVAKFRLRDVAPQAERLREGLKTWAGAAVDTLREARPEMPGGLQDRAEEVWEPLIVIADLAGADWPARAREAALALNGGEPDTESHNVMLLQAIRAMFDDEDNEGREPKDKLTTTDLLAGLVDRESEPWPGWWGKEVDSAAKEGRAPRKAPGELAKHLRPFGVQPKNIRTADGVSKGYDRADFADAFSRYLPQKPTQEPQEPTRGRYNATTVGAQGFEPLRLASGGQQAATPETLAAQGLWRCSGLKPPEERNSENGTTPPKNRGPGAPDSAVAGVVRQTIAEMGDMPAPADRLARANSAIELTKKEGETWAGAPNGVEGAKRREAGSKGVPSGRPGSVSSATAEPVERGSL
jgi:hypothetical protein